MTEHRTGRHRSVPNLGWVLALAIALVSLFGAHAVAEDRSQLFVTREAGFARIVLTFPDRHDLPAYRIRHDNGVLALEFEEPLSLSLPDVAAALPEYLSIARVDPDRKGVRFGLTGAFNLNRIEAGERLFVDLLPTSWMGLPPSLPQSVIDGLAARAKQAAMEAEQKRRAELARTLQPEAEVRVGLNPTFLRIQFNWTVDTEAAFSLEEDRAVIQFDWPVPIDLYALSAGLPEEFEGATNDVDVRGSRVTMRVAEGVEPRFYQLSPQQFVVDIDIDREAGIGAAIALEEALEAERVAAAQAAASAAADGADGGDTAVAGGGVQTEVTPVVSMVGSTIRIAFPFEQDTSAAVFRRGDTVWMLFDTPAAITAPPPSQTLSSVASGFEVVPAGDTKIVRMDLSRERLATLGSEGRSWVLSLGDVLLGATEPVTLRRERDEEGHFFLNADMARPHQVHLFRDPAVGDTLKVVTAFPPARGMSRTLSYVDFDLLRTVHGLVVRPETEELDVAVSEGNAIITAPGGLVMSALESLRVFDSGNATEFRVSYIDLGALKQDDPAAFAEQRQELVERASATEGRLRDAARLDLASFYVANRFAHEALGVLGVMEDGLTAEDLRHKARLVRGIANTLAARPAEALAIFNGESFSEHVDALMWRSMAKLELYDYQGARADALVAEPVVDVYPGWVRTRFLLSAVRAAIKTNDAALALRLMGKVDFATLDPEQVTEYRLLEGMIAESENRINDALETYGQVIAADIRPTRAEAVYRTLAMLDSTGEIDVVKATETLSAETLMWRGNPLEADMQKLLAELHFRNKQFRQGFETVKQAVQYYPESRAINALLEQAQAEFAELYLNGRADELDPIEALSIYYDFRQLTPPGPQGDEMIRNLARRLVKLDLLTQAADLLEYQIDSRLRGVAQARIAADLAVIRIADRNPEGALRVLNRTRIPDISPTLDRQRRILEARALIDADRQDLAIDLLSRVTGRDADLLRVEGHWKARNFVRAAELLEVMYSPGTNPDPLTPTVRKGVVRAAVGFALANERLGLNRLRAKFSELMVTTPEWEVFDYVTGDAIATSIEFRKVAREVSGLDSLNAFLDTYRELYAGDSMTPDRAVAPRGV